MARANSSDCSATDRIYDRCPILKSDVDPLTLHCYWGSPGSSMQDASRLHVGLRAHQHLITSSGWGTRRHDEGKAKDGAITDRLLASGSNSPLYYTALVYVIRFATSRCWHRMPQSLTTRFPKPLSVAKRQRAEKLSKS